MPFDRAEGGERAFLVFEGITYAASVVLNGKPLGEMLPYSEYRFEITDCLLEKENLLTVSIRDLDVVFGPSEGWENYSGIIRDVYIEYTSDSYLRDIIWNGALSDGYSRGRCEIEALVDTKRKDAGAKNMDTAAENTDTGAKGTDVGVKDTDTGAKDTDPVVRAVLEDRRGRIVGEGTRQGSGRIEFEIEGPELWSPDTPCLYTLRCILLQDGKEVDCLSQKVGFKDFRVQGKRFYLNGEPLFLLGVNRHDLYGDRGHTLTEEEMRKDMQMIKESGVNFVRLVHYPHNKRIIALADELGLLVSEEPGLWWSDMHNPEICAGALAVLKKVIERDRNHISIAFWLSFNECIFTLDFLKDAARVCRDTDPYHMVSGANCMDLTMTKENFTRCGFDFYTMHPYGPTVDRLVESAKTLTEMPLLLTEWGGFYCWHSERLFREFIRTILTLWRNPDSEPVLAGAVFWCWADIYEFHRGGAACQDGILQEGLVDINRNPTVNLQIFTEEFAKLRQPEPAAQYRIEYETGLTAEGRLIPLNLETASAGGAEAAVSVSSANAETLPAANPAEWAAAGSAQNSAVNESAWEAMIRASKEPIPRFYNERKAKRPMEKGPVLPEDIRMIGRFPVRLRKTPYVLCDVLRVPIGKPVSEIYVFGNVSMPRGFPIGGEYGEIIADYTVAYEDGSLETYPMKNGTDFTTASGIYGPSRIDPQSENSPRALRFSWRYDFEQYVINVGTLKTNPEKTTVSLTLTRRNDTYFPLLYGITVKEAKQATR